MWVVPDGFGMKGLHQSLSYGKNVIVEGSTSMLRAEGWQMSDSPVFPFLIFKNDPLFKLNWMLI